MAKTSMDGGVYLPQSSLELYAAYIMKTIHVSNRQTLVDLRELLTLIDPNKIYSVEEVLERNSFKFLKQLVDARLKGYENQDILVQSALTGIDTGNLFHMDTLNQPLSSNELGYIENNIIETRNEYYTITTMNNLSLLNENLTLCDEGERHRILHEAKRNIIDVNRKIRLEGGISSISETFSLADDEQYEATIEHVFNRNIAESTKLKCGMESFNKSLNGGYENDRCYIYLGLPGEGKSSTLLNLALQIKMYNKEVKTKDPTKKPCLLFLTMENTLDETIERMFSILVSDENMGNFESSKEVYRLLRQNGLAVTDESPINIVFKYVPSNSVTTDYLYTLYDELLAEGQEVICLIQDYIKRIKCRDHKIFNGDMRLGLGAVVDEFKEFAIAKHIPVITASQMNRDAAKIIDEGRHKNEAELVRKIGRSNIGESSLITENADSAFIIVPETGADGVRYLGVSNAKKRFKNQSSQWFYQPYSVDRPLALLPDVHLAQPLYKTSLNDLKIAANGWGKPVEKAKVITDLSNLNISEDYDVSPDFVESVNKYIKKKGDRIKTKDDVKNIVLENGQLFGEMTSSEQDLLYISCGFEPINGPAKAIRPFNRDSLEDSTPKALYGEYINPKTNEKITYRKYTKAEVEKMKAVPAFTMLYADF